MDIHEAPADPGGFRPTVPACTGTHVLAAALSHVLRRDGDRPARWHVAAFAEAVESARANLSVIWSFQTLRASEVIAGRELRFDEAVARLAANPADVAVAIRRLELGGRQRLPSWPELVRRGLPDRPSDLDAALWFG